MPVPTAPELMRGRHAEGSYAERSEQGRATSPIGPRNLTPRQKTIATGQDIRPRVVSAINEDAVRRTLSPAPDRQTLLSGHGAHKRGFSPPRDQSSWAPPTAQGHRRAMSPRSASPPRARKQSPEGSRKLASSSSYGEVLCGDRPSYPDGALAHSGARPYASVVDAYLSKQAEADEVRFQRHSPCTGREPRAGARRASPLRREGTPRQGASASAPTWTQGDWKACGEGVSEPAATDGSSLQNRSTAPTTREATQASGTGGSSAHCSSSRSMLELLERSMEPAEQVARRAARSGEASMVTRPSRKLPNGLMESRQSEHAVSMADGEVLDQTQESVPLPWAMPGERPGSKARKSVTLPIHSKNPRLAAKIEVSSGTASGSTRLREEDMQNRTAEVVDQLEHRVRDGGPNQMDPIDTSMETPAWPNPNLMEFCRLWGLDQATVEWLATFPPEVQAAAIEQFKPNIWPKERIIQVNDSEWEDDHSNAGDPPSQQIEPPDYHGRPASHPHGQQDRPFEIQHVVKEVHAHGFQINDLPPQPVGDRKSVV